MVGSPDAGAEIGPASANPVSTDRDPTEDAPSPGTTPMVRFARSCQTCHGDEAWRPATFDHAKLFRFDRHHPSDCINCHQENDYSRYSCYGCHEHSPAKICEEHWEEGILEFENCVECHRSGDENEAERL